MTRFEFYLNLNKYKDKQDEKNEENSLQHYGTLGQKWGVRKWQNPDGTFNEAGKERYFGKNGTTKKITSDEKVGGNFWNQTKARTFMNITDQGKVKHIKKYADYFDIDGLSDDEILKVVRMTPNRSNTYGIPYADDINAALHDYKVKKSLTKATDTYADNNQKVGVMGIYDIAAAVESAIDGMHNYDDVQALRDSYDKYMDASDAEFTKEERLSIMNNKKKIAKMQDALGQGDKEKYNKLLNKLKGADKEAAEKLLNDINKKNNETSKVSEENQKLLDEQLGSLSKPKINKHYLNADGTLNEKGKLRTASNRKISDIASSIFLALRNFKFFEAASMPVAGIILSLTGFGIPAVLAGTIAGAITTASGGIDHALYKKLEKRADAYYEMLQ